jgi:hypothetical protein
MKGSGAPEKQPDSMSSYYRASRHTGIPDRHDVYRSDGNRNVSKHHQAMLEPASVVAT